MEVFCSLSETKNENQLIETSVRSAAARYTDEKWNIYGFEAAEGVRSWLSEEPVVDYLSWDVTVKGALRELVTVRSSCPAAFLIIVADSSVSPLSYLKPQLAPGALIMKPVRSENVRQVMEEILEADGLRRKQSSEDLFLVETREEKRYIPLLQIDYFEAREKKIFARTKSEEYGFYRSLDELESSLPAHFVRCHRGFIVNMKRADSVSSAQKCIMMKDGLQVPYSRTCRAAVMGYLENEKH